MALLLWRIESLQKCPPIQQFTNSFHEPSVNKGGTFQWQIINAALGILTI